jgi:hypothetical protein
VDAAVCSAALHAEDRVCSFIWFLIVGVAYIKSINSEGVSGKLLASYIIQTSLYFALCLLCVVGFWAAWSVSAGMCLLVVAVVTPPASLQLVAELNTQLTAYSDIRIHHPQSKIKAGKLWVLSTYLGSVILIAAQIVHIALHFAFKKDVLNSCEYDARIDYPASSSEEIADWCASDWRGDIW